MAEQGPVLAPATVSREEPPSLGPLRRSKHVIISLSFLFEVSNVTDIAEYFFPLVLVYWFFQEEHPPVLSYLF